LAEEIGAPRDVTCDRVREALQPARVLRHDVLLEDREVVGEVAAFGDVRRAARLRTVKADAHRRRAHIAEAFAGGGPAHGDLVVGGGQQLERTEFVEQPAAREHARPGHVTALGELRREFVAAAVVVDGQLARHVAHAERPALRVHEDHAAVDHVDVRMGLQVVVRSAQVAGQQAIVGRAKDDVVAAREREAAVVIGREPDVRLVLDVAQPRIGRKAGDHLIGVVGRRVIHDDQFELRKILAEDARDCLADVVRVVVRRDDDADERPLRGARIRVHIRQIIGRARKDL